MKYIAILALILTCLVPDVAAQRSKKQGKTNYRLIAHRGGVVDSTSAENSLAALQKAVDKGYYMVEIDLRLTKDSVLIIHHDRNFKRYYGVDSPVGDMTWSEVSQLVGDKGNRVLKFEEALKFCSENGLQVMVDNKIRGNDNTLFTGVVDLLKQYNLHTNALMIGTEESTEFFTGKIKLSCTRQQLEDNMKKPGYKPSHYYLFSGDISKEEATWAKKNNIMAVGAINAWGMKSADKMEEAGKRANALKASGVKYFQIDSVFDVFFHQQFMILRPAAPLAAGLLILKPMKYTILLLLAGLFAIHEAKAQKQADFTHDVKGNAVPWTHTDFKNKPENFSFAIVADRTNGHRVGVFRSAIEKINDLQPEFVLSVGDLIEGYTTDTVELRRQWNEFNGLLKPLQMPFFRVPGNHDVSNEVQKALWAKQFGRDYYHFIYKDVLFLVLNSTDGDGVPFSEPQLAYAEKTIQNNPNVRWTFVLMHHPVWNKRDENGFHRVEKALANRKYTVIAGHTHRYMASVHNDRNYYVLATTGGSTRLRGAEFGETDHISWVTMTEEGPSLVNLELDGILKDDFSNERTRQLGTTLAEDAAFKPVVLLPAVGGAGEGRVYLNLRNSEELPLKVETRFFQHPALQVTGAPAKVILQQGRQQQLALNLRQLSNNGFAAGDTLHMQYSLKYASDEKGLPHLAGTFDLPVKPTAPDIIERSMPVFTSSRLVEIKHEYEGAKVVYTLDGSEPGPTSKVYAKPFSIDRSTTVKAKVVTEKGDAASLSETAVFEKLAFMNPAKVRKKGLAKGLKYTYYEGAFKKLPDFSLLKPIKSGVMKDFDLDAIKQRANQFAVLIEGYVEIREDDLYTFYLTSDDGAKLFIGDQLIVDNDGSHSARTKTGYAALKRGLHPIRIEYFEDFDGELIQLEYAGEGRTRKEVPFRDFYLSR